MLIFVHPSKVLQRAQQDDIIKRVHKHIALTTEKEKQISVMLQPENFSDNNKKDIFRLL